MHINLPLPFDLKDPFMSGLAYAALHPGLRSILVYDSSPAVIQTTATRLESMLREVTRREVVVIRLGAHEAEDDLWGMLKLKQNRVGSTFSWQPGRLVNTPEDRSLRLVVIPDLARMSLPAARACVVLMGAEVAYLERHGQDMAWVPNCCWLAGCARSDIGQVSLHLLDRFALRLPGPKDDSIDRVVSVLAWLANPLSEEHPEIATLPSTWRKLLVSAAHRQPALDKAVIAHVLEFFREADTVGIRRELALVRLAIAHAQLAGDDLVTTGHIEEAAKMIGLKHDVPMSKNSRVEPPNDLEPRDKMLEKHQVVPQPPLEIVPSKTHTVSSEDAPVYSPNVQETFPAEPLSGPYPEDDAPIDREVASLQLQPLYYRSAIASNGSIIGTERATNLHDLALVSTLLEAAKFKTVRRKYTLKRAWDGLIDSIRWGRLDILAWTVLFRNRLLISSTDLRSYRRMPSPEQMLVLVLDYTCLQECDWEASVLPHLEWAYVARASVCLIQVGAATATGSAVLRAQQIVAPSILAPRIRNAFQVGPGQATPLAHGLDLAAHTLQTAMQHGRSAVRQGRLVVLSDGRGNVPLESSRAGTIKWPVAREGIENALLVARSIRGLKNVEKFLLNPQPQQYPNLPIALAEALGVVPDAIPLKDSGRSDNE